LHFHWWPIDRVETAKIAEQLVNIGGGTANGNSAGLMLSGDQNIVITRDRSYSAEGADVVHSLEDALALAKRREGDMANAEEICVIGGGEIFTQALPLADRLHVTHILASIEGDSYFPPIDPAQWRIVREQDFAVGEKDSHATRYAVYERR
jgi:dihydrofolate reductase